MRWWSGANFVTFSYKQCEKFKFLDGKNSFFYVRSGSRSFTHIFFENIKFMWCKATTIIIITKICWSEHYREFVTTISLAKKFGANCMRECNLCHLLFIDKWKMEWDEIQDGGIATSMFWKDIVRIYFDKPKKCSMFHAKFC
jgi:hypothetical protein